MAIKIYDFDYGAFEASVQFRVDTETFTQEIANLTLEFFTWDYDKAGDPIDEVLKKYAIEAIVQATKNNHNELGVISDFNDLEGFCPLDGSIGLTLISVSGYEFDERSLTLATWDERVVSND